MDQQKCKKGFLLGDRMKDDVHVNILAKGML